MCIKENCTMKHGSTRKIGFRTNKTPTKPKLCRKITQSAKVNLNLYWDKFETYLATPAPQRAVLQQVSTSLRRLPFQDVTNVTAQNEHNDNVANELKEETDFGKLLSCKRFENSLTLK